MTRYELQALTLVPTQIISAATCKPIISIVQDTLVGAYLLTSKINTIDRKLFDNMMMKNVIFNMAKYALKDAKTYNGHQAYSTILPDFSFHDMDVEIINGVFQKGILNKKLLGGTAGGLIQNIYNIYGDKEAQRFLDATQNVITRWLEIHSFSIGYGDCSPTKKIQTEIDTHIETVIGEAQALMKKAQLGLYNPKIDESLLAASMEMDMTNMLGNIGIKIEKILQDQVSNENRFKVAVESGSKGSYVNLRQVVGSVGQQIVWSSRITNGFTERTLPHFFKTDYGPMAKGYIKNSFFRGMTPTEFFFHMMAGRTGTIDTAIKTASTGYISRRLMKAMEDIKVEYDYTVRNSFGNIVQFIYGEDSFDPVKLELNILKIIQYSDADMKREFQFDEMQDKKYWKKLILPTVVEEFMKEKDYMEKLNTEFKKLMEIRTDLRYKYMKNLDVITNNVCYLPINFYRLLPIIKNKFEITDANIPNLSPTYIIAEVEKLILKCRRYVTQDIGLPYLEIMIRMYLSSKQILTVFRLSKVAFDFLTMTIHNKVLSAFAQYGEMVGAIAAQSIGEPSTQLTLNTFHLSGTKANVTEGVPRLSEIISVSKDILKPIMNIYLKDDYSESMEKANTLASQIEYTKIGDLVVETDILYEAQKESSMEEDIEFIKTYYEFNEMFDLDIKDVENLSNWVLRIIFDKELMMNKDITMSEIQTAIIQNVTAEDSVQCIFSDDNSGDLVMRIRIRNDLDNDNYIVFLDEFEKSVRNITLRGIPGVPKVFPMEANQVKYNPDSTYTNKKVWKLISEGSNLIDIMKNDFVDPTITDTNNISEILDILGLEAARNAIIQETTAVFISVKINYRHIALLADCMCARGSIMKIHRFGINRSPDHGVVARASFEEINDVLITASLFSSKDNMKGTSANIMMGQMVKAGTNAFNLLLDEEILTNIKINDSQDNEEESSLNVNQVDNDIEQMYEDHDEDLAVTDSDFDFGYHLDDTDEYDLGNQPHVIPSLSKEALTVAEKLINEMPTKTKKIKVISVPKEDDIITDVEPHGEEDDEKDMEEVIVKDVEKPKTPSKSALKKIKVVKKETDVDEVPVAVKKGKSGKSSKKKVTIADE